MALLSPLCLASVVILPFQKAENRSQGFYRLDAYGDRVVLQWLFLVVLPSGSLIQPQAISCKGYRTCLVLWNTYFYCSLSMNLSLLLQSTICINYFYRSQAKFIMLIFFWVKSYWFNYIFAHYFLDGVYYVHCIYMYTCIYYISQDF